jgi:hypothetical protein
MEFRSKFQALRRVINRLRSFFHYQSNRVWVFFCVACLRGNDKRTVKGFFLDAKERKIRGCGEKLFHDKSSMVVRCEGVTSGAVIGGGMTGIGAADPREAREDKSSQASASPMPRPVHLLDHLWHQPFWLHRVGIPWLLELP